MERWGSSSLVRINVKGQIPRTTPAFSTNQGESFPFLLKSQDSKKTESKANLQPSPSAYSCCSMLPLVVPHGMAWSLWKRQEEHSLACVFKSVYESRKRLETEITLLSGCVILGGHLTSLSRSTGVAPLTVTNVEVNRKNCICTQVHTYTTHTYTHK